MNCGLVLEGGARRGVYTAGVLDCLAEHGVTFPYVVGVSAGAAAAMDFVSGQIGRTRWVFSPKVSDARTPLKKIQKAAQTLDLDKLVYEYPYFEENPFDFKGYFNSPTVCEFVATNCLTGEAEYFREQQEEKRLLDTVRASCSVPLMYTPAEVDGAPYLDGSIGDAVPFERAFDCGCDRALVVLTKAPGEEATDYRRMRPLVLARYEKRYPQLCERLFDRFDRYVAQRERIEQAETAGHVMVLRPVSDISPFEMNEERIESLYREGYDMAMRELPRITAFVQGVDTPQAV